MQHNLSVAATPILGRALVCRVAQPSSGRSGTYSPNGTSRTFWYEPSDPSGPMSTEDL